MSKDPARSVATLMWSIAAAIVIATYVGVVLPAQRRIAALEAQTHAAVAQSARYRAELRTERAISAASARVTAALRRDAGNTAADDGAAVLAAAERAARAAGVGIVSIGASPQSSDVDLRARGGFGALLHFLQALPVQATPVGVQAVGLRLHARTADTVTLDLRLTARPYHA